MDDFKKKTLFEYGSELSLAHEYEKHKLRKKEKKILKRLSRRRLNQDLKEELN